MRTGTWIDFSTPKGTVSEATRKAPVTPQGGAACRALSPGERNPPPPDKAPAGKNMAIEGFCGWVAEWYVMRCG